jgi:hypothetical protein
VLDRASTVASQCISRSVSSRWGCSPLGFFLLPVALVAQLSPSRNDKDHCRDAKDDRYAKGLIMNWEIIRSGGWKERYQREA